MLLVRGTKKVLERLSGATASDADRSTTRLGDWYDGSVVGWVTSGAYAHHVGRSLGFGYVPAPLATPGAKFEVEIIGHRRPARLLTEPAFDPAGERMRA